MPHILTPLHDWLDARPSQHAKIRRNGAWASAFAALLAVPIMLACMPAAITVNSLPANQVYLTVTITNQYAATPQVRVEAQLLLARNPNNPLEVTVTHTLTCDGVSVLHGLDTSGFAFVPRQSAGGAYTWVYTDERGQRTTLLVSVPLGRFAMISPVANDALPIPRPGSRPSAIPSVVPPSPEVNAPAASPNITASPPPGSPVAALMIHYVAPIIPDGVIATFQASAICDRLAPAECGMVPGPALPATGDYTLSDTYARFNNGFEAFTPGQGELDVTFLTQWQIPDSGFNVALVRFREQQNLPITWTP